MAKDSKRREKTSPRQEKSETGQRRDAFLSCVAHDGDNPFIAVGSKRRCTTRWEFSKDNDASETGWRHVRKRQAQDGHLFPSCLCLFSVGA